MLSASALPVTTASEHSRPATVTTQRNSGQENVQTPALEYFLLFSYYLCIFNNGRGSVLEANNLSLLLHSLTLGLSFLLAFASLLHNRIQLLFALPLSRQLLYYRHSACTARHLF